MLVLRRTSWVRSSTMQFISRYLTTAADHNRGLNGHGRWPGRRSPVLIQCACLGLSGDLRGGACTAISTGTCLASFWISRVIQEVVWVDAQEDHDRWQQERAMSATAPMGLLVPSR